MRRRLRALLLATALPAMLGAGPPPPIVPLELQPPVAPAVVVERYAAALEARPRPPNLSFEISVEQLGPRNLEQTHRIYRSGLDERDEILSVDGQTLTRPAVRILQNRTYRYDLGQVAPKISEYAFVYRKTERVGAHVQYLFDTTPHDPGAYAVSNVTIDGESYLPNTIAFRIAGGGTHGSGHMTFGKVDRFWVIRETAVTVHTPGGGLARERIAWSKYQFPSTLPSSTFSVRRPAPVETPTP